MSSQKPDVVKSVLLILVCCSAISYVFIYLNHGKNGSIETIHTAVIPSAVPVITVSAHEPVVESKASIPNINETVTLKDEDDGINTLIVGPNNITLVWDPAFHVYKYKGKAIIWVFWDKPSMPAIIGLGMASIECNNPEFHLQRVSLDDIALWIDHVHPAFKYLIPAHKADYFRARVLDCYGGIYLDSDSIGLNSFWNLYQKLSHYDVINISWPPDGDLISITSMGPMRAQSPFTAKWVSGVHILLDKRLGSMEAKNGDPLGWADMLRMITKPLIEKLLTEKADFSLFSVTGHRSFGQIIVSGLEPHSADITKVGFNWTETELLMFHNSAIGGDICEMSLQEFLNGSPVLIAEIFRLTFRECYQNRNITSPIKDHRFSQPKQLWVGVPKERIVLSNEEMEWVRLYLHDRNYVVKGV